MNKETSEKLKKAVSDHFVERARPIVRAGEELMAAFDNTEAKIDGLVDNLKAAGFPVAIPEQTVDYEFRQFSDPKAEHGKHAELRRSFIVEVGTEKTQIKLVQTAYDNGTKLPPSETLTAYAKVGNEWVERSHDSSLASSYWVSNDNQFNAFGRDFAKFVTEIDQQERAEKARRIICNTPKP
ncbi:MAG: hypothetical protein OXT65_08445 [Alphaproteobacteria bacterium]|nr:hypothetical protein [Alphaproteobacteria bacterium]